MAELTVQKIIRLGLTPSFTAASSGGDEFINDGRTFIYVKNGVTDVTLTATAQTTVAVKPGFGDIPISDLEATVSESTEGVIGPFPKAIFNNADGKVEISYDDESNVTIAALQLPVDP